MRQKEVKKEEVGSKGGNGRGRETGRLESLRKRKRERKLRDWRCEVLAKGSSLRKGEKRSLR